MIVRTRQQLIDTGRYREKPGVFTSARYLLQEDDVGFTMTMTTLAAGQSQTLQYKHHIEANLVIEGHGQLTDIATSTVYALEPGTMYTLDKHDRHEIDAQTDMTLVCIFTPALVGDELHDEDGSYPPAPQA